MQLAPIFITDARLQILYSRPLNYPIKNCKVNGTFLSTGNKIKDYNNLSNLGDCFGKALQVSYVHSGFNISNSGNIK